ncbi:MAG: cyclic nucleotide-binding domain-containing protein [Verrucomicrobiota bacterium]
MNEMEVEKNHQDSSQGEIRCYEKDEIIFSENEVPDGVYIVKDGVVEIFHTVTNDKDGKSAELQLGRIGVRGMFGEMGLIDHHPRCASARALGPTRCIFIDRKEFNNHLSSLPPWVSILIKSFVARLRESNRLLYQVLEDNKTKYVEESELLIHHGSEESNSNEKSHSNTVTQVLKVLGHEE